MIEELQGCCGIGVISELSGNGNAFDTLRELYCECETRTKYYDYGARIILKRNLAPRFGLVIWSDATVNTEGKALAAYIRRHKLGPVKKSVQAKNPNNNNETTIQHWTWKPDWEKFFSFMKEKT